MLLFHLPSNTVGRCSHEEKARCSRKRSRLLISRRCVVATRQLNRRRRQAIGEQERCTQQERTSKGFSRIQTTREQNERRSSSVRTSERKRRQQRFKQQQTRETSKRRCYCRLLFVLVRKLAEGVMHHTQFSASYRSSCNILQHRSDLETCSLLHFPFVCYRKNGLKVQKSSNQFSLQEKANRKMKHLSTSYVQLPSSLTAIHMCAWVESSIHHQDLEQGSGFPRHFFASDTKLKIRSLRFFITIFSHTYS